MTTIISWGAMRKSTYNGLRCSSKGIKMCMSWRICSIPYVESWVSNIQRNIWCWSTAIFYTDTFKRKWSFSTYSHLVRHTGMLPRLSRNSNRRSETLDMRIESERKVPPNRRTKDKVKAWWLKTTYQSHKQRTIMWSRRRTWESGVSSIRAPLTTQVSVGPNNHWWPRWGLLNQMHAPTLNQNLRRGMTEGSRLLMRSPMPLFPPWRSKRKNRKI